MIIKSLSFSKNSVVKRSSVYTKTQTGVSKFFQREEFFRKAAFLTGWISVDGRPNRWNIAASSNFSSLGFYIRVLS